ncbi:hypothetical protein EVA_14213 [gut metagenome]|uniref:Uncharacterized protein n=1 Tax=gut metagenome TaxID=749906 RepID=J9FRW1_9ZZZZ
MPFIAQCPALGFILFLSDETSFANSLAQLVGTRSLLVAATNTFEAINNLFSLHTF